MAFVTPIYTVGSLVDNLNKITENLVVSTSDNINHPDSTYFQTILFELLKQVGFSSSIVTVSPNQLNIDCASQAELNLLKDTLPVDTLMLASRFFFNRVGGCDVEFGIIDLLDPKPIRVRKFLSVLVNFWLFCNNQFTDCLQLKDNIQQRAFKQQDLKNRIDEFRRKIEDIRQSKAKEEMKAKKVLNDIEEIDKELARVVVAADETKKKLEPVKVRLGELRVYEEALLKEIETIEAVEKRLKVLVRADEMKHSLEQELQKENEEFESKMMQQEGYQNREILLHQQELDIRSFLEMLLSIASHLKKIRGLVDDLKAKEADLDSVRKSISAKDERLMQILKEAADLKAEMMSGKSKWNKKKACMESELNDFNEKLNLIRQEMSEEDVVSSELETSIRQMRATIVNEDRLMKEDILKSKHVFHQVKSSLATFSLKMESDLEVIQEAMEKLEKFRP